MFLKYLFAAGAAAGAGSSSGLRSTLCPSSACEGRTMPFLFSGWPRARFEWYKGLQLDTEACGTVLGWAGFSGHFQHHVLL